MLPTLPPPTTNRRVQERPRGDALQALLKACVAAGGERGGLSMMAAIESFTLNLEDEEKREENIQAFDKVLQLIWEWEIVSEEDIRAWQARSHRVLSCLSRPLGSLIDPRFCRMRARQADERTARLLRITIDGARSLRERGEVFIDWLEHGEE